MCCRLGFVVLFVGCCGIGAYYGDDGEISVAYRREGDIVVGRGFGADYDDYDYVGVGCRSADGSRDSRDVVERAGGDVDDDATDDHLDDDCWECAAAVAGRFVVWDRGVASCVLRPGAVGVAAAVVRAVLVDCAV